MRRGDRGYALAMSQEDPDPKTDPDTAAGASNLEKDPSDWVTGDEAMTGAQASYLKTLCEQAGETFEPNLTKAQASQRIDELRERVRGRRP